MQLRRDVMLMVIPVFVLERFGKDRKREALRQYRFFVLSFDLERKVKE